MAWTYLEQTIAGGEIQDPRDFNENMQAYVAEMAQLDRDNLKAAVITGAKLVAPTLATAGNKYTFTGQFNKITFWEKTTTDTVTLGTDMNAGIFVADLGGSFTTGDASLIIDLSLAYAWSGAAGAADDENRVIFQLLLDSIVIAETGELPGAYFQDIVQLYAQVAVGAGTHDVRAQVRGFLRNDAAGTPMELATHNVDITDRSLLVREVKR